MLEIVLFLVYLKLAFSISIFYLKKPIYPQIGIGFFMIYLDIRKTIYV